MNINYDYNNMFLMKIFLYSVYVIADKYVCQNAQISRSSGTIPIAIFANDVFLYNKGNKQDCNVSFGVAIATKGCRVRFPYRLSPNSMYYT